MKGKPKSFQEMFGEGKSYIPADNKEPVPTVRAFLLKKYPPNKYTDCPVPKQYWEDMEKYASLREKAVIEALKKEKEYEAVRFGELINSILVQKGVGFPIPIPEFYKAFKLSQDK